MRLLGESRNWTAAGCRDRPHDCWMAVPLRRRVLPLKQKWRKDRCLGSRPVVGPSSPLGSLPHFPGNNSCPWPFGLKSTFGHDSLSSHLLLCLAAGGRFSCLWTAQLLNNEYDWFVRTSPPRLRLLGWTLRAAGGGLGGPAPRRSVPIKVMIIWLARSWA